jgi:hypothetical protein
MINNISNGIHFRLRPSVREKDCVLVSVSPPREHPEVRRLSAVCVKRNYILYQKTVG